MKKSFGRHVHWGYGDDPQTALCDDEDYAAAAAKLTLELGQLAGIAEGQDVLDVGCGFGGTIASLNERFGRLERRDLIQLSSAKVGESAYCRRRQSDDGSSAHGQ